MIIRFAGTLCLIALVGEPSSAGAQRDFGDQAAIVQFQRSVDAYAFQHRQVDTRLGEAADQAAVAAGMRAARPAAADGDVFTPTIAAAFRNRIAIAFRQGCNMAATGPSSSEVPRVGTRAIVAREVPSCLRGVLPRLPEELEYRATSAALILLDTHAGLVVDALHGAFPAPPP
jgi:hypothetical protein